MNKLRHSAAGDWISLIDFASRRSISLSTLRRHIKTNKITYKIENGRYLLWDDETPDTHFKDDDTQNENHHDVKQIQSALQKAQEEIAELKTLIALYEETNPLQKFHE